VRPATEVRQAILQAVTTMATPDRGPTLQEINQAVCSQMPVGTDTVRRYLDNIKRSGAVCIARERRVDYRNRPVAEYAPAGNNSNQIQQGWVDLGRSMADWVR
jgi:hypothetical protein